MEETGRDSFLSTTGLSLPEAGPSRTTTSLSLAIPGSEWGLELQEAVAGCSTPTAAAARSRLIDKDAESRLLEQGLYSYRLFGSALANPRLSLAQKIFVTLEVPTSSGLVSAECRCNAAAAAARGMPAARWSLGVGTAGKMHLNGNHDLHRDCHNDVPCLIAARGALRLPHMPAISALQRVEIS
jgi:hypothetical protein